MRRPRAGDETLLLHPGGAGAPPGDTRIPCEELADGGPLGLPEVRKERLTRKAPRASSRRQDETERQKARPGADKTLRWRAERRRTFARRCARTAMTRRLARHPLDLIEGPRRDDGVPRAAKNTGSGALAISMQPELAVDRLELGRLDQLAMRDLHRVQRTFELVLPERQEAHQLGKFWK